MGQTLSSSTGRPSTQITVPMGVLCMTHTSSIRAHTCPFPQAWVSHGVSDQVISTLSN